MKPTLFVADEIENFRFAPDAPNISIDMSPIVVYHILTLECACHVNFYVSIHKWCTINDECYCYVVLHECMTPTCIFHALVQPLLNNSRREKSHDKPANQASHESGSDVSSQQGDDERRLSQETVYTHISSIKMLKTPVAQRVGNKTMLARRILFFIRWQNYLHRIYSTIFRFLKAHKRKCCDFLQHRLIFMLCCCR